MDWLAKLLHLPPSFLSEGGGTGVIQPSASEATLIALLSARARALKGRPPEDALRLVAYCRRGGGGGGAWGRSTGPRAR